jgi:hypothetical protein
MQRLKLGNKSRQVGVLNTFMKNLLAVPLSLLCLFVLQQPVWGQSALHERLGEQLARTAEQTPTIKRCITTPDLEQPDCWSLSLDTLGRNMEPEADEPAQVKPPALRWLEAELKFALRDHASEERLRDAFTTTRQADCLRAERQEGENVVTDLVWEEVCYQKGSDANDSLIAQISLHIKRSSTWYTATYDYTLAFDEQGHLNHWRVRQETEAFIWGRLNLTEQENTLSYLQP